MKNEFMAMRPQGGFKVILADPPWSYENWSNNGEEKNPNAHYDCMTIDDIAEMPVEALAAKDCVLFMWVTWPLMPEWHKVIKAWGFEFAGLGWEWIKYNPVTDKYAFGMGYGTRKNLEPCIIATRGNPSLKRGFSNDLFGAGDNPEGVRSVRDFIEYHPLDCIRAPKREHSRKPDEQYQRIETMFDGPYCELFARQAWQGWSAWGNQVDKFDVKEAS
ncbi:MAG: MT-A70 family methyltransferase [Sneathiella sp.]